MGYLFLALALAAGGMKGYCGKKTSGAIVHGSDSMVMNGLRMGLCVVIGFLLILVQRELPSLLGDGAFFFVTALYHGFFVTVLL